MEYGVQHNRGNNNCQKKTKKYKKINKIDENKNEENETSLSISIVNVHALKNEKVDIFTHKSDSTVKYLFDNNNIVCVTGPYRNLEL